MEIAEFNCEARCYKKIFHKAVQCRLCPRCCLIEDGKVGFCRVRMNRGGTLYALSYGRAVQISEEVIETEGVFHFEPSSRTLAIGNVGCNMRCVYCQNWRFSQIEDVDETAIFDYTPQQIVRIAIEKNIKILSWTYNDPAIWFEFVWDTARLARKHGIYNLFKSALFLNPETIELLMEVIDIFSISIKSLSNTFYRELTGAWIEPVLEGTKKIYKNNRHHMEVSNLVVTGANDTERDYMQVIDWVKQSLSVDVPLHFVRFHPDYKYTHVPRTPVVSLETARNLARQAGIRYCYLGNLFVHEGLNTYCQTCGHILVARTGLHSRLVGVERGEGYYRCRKCRSNTPIRMFDR